MISRRSILKATSALLTSAAWGTLAFAQDQFPSRQIKIVVANAPGGTDDLISRLVAEKVSADLGQTVIVENRGGGATTVGGMAVASAEADGHTLLCLINTGIVQPVLREEKLPYGLKDFAPIIGVGGFPLALAVSAESGITSIGELTAVAAAADGITFASGGVGTMAHLNSIRFLRRIGGNGVHVTYKNNPEGLQALVGGFTQMMFASASEVAPLQADGLIRVLAVTSPQRAINLPDVPTMAELGFPEIDTLLWHGFVAPAGTPDAVVAALATEITAAVKAPAFQDRMNPMAFQEDIRTGAELVAFLDEQSAIWRQVIEENNVEVTD